MDTENSAFGGKEHSHYCDQQQFLMDKRLVICLLADGKICCVLSGQSFNYLWFNIASEILLGE